jgi:hypothetical protein
MTNEIILQIVTFILGGVIGAILKTSLDYKKEILSKLWEMRFDKYKDVWKETEVLPQYPKNKDVTYDDLSKTSTKLKEWYFSKGGILMSTQTRKAYGKLQEKLNEKRSAKLTDKVDVEYEKIREEFSRFRTSLTKDLTSRNNKLYHF